jgi:hypothetical protein
MAQYRLPDGRILTVPDNASREELIGIQNRLSDLYPDYYQQHREEVQTTFGGHLEELVKGVPRGLAGAFISAGEGVSNLLSVGNESGASRYFRDLQKKLNESAVGVDQGYEDAFSAKLGAGLGSFAAFAIPATATAKALGVAGKLSRAQQALRANKITLPQYEKMRRSLYMKPSLAAMSLAVPVGISEQGRNIALAREMDEEVSPFKEIVSEVLGGGIGATEVFPLFSMFKRMPKAAGPLLKIPQRLRQAATTGTAEALQESLAGIAQDVVATGIYSDKIPIGESFLDDFTVGGATGAIADLIFRGVAGRKSLGNAYEREREAELRKKTEARFKTRAARTREAEAAGAPSISPELQPERDPQLELPLTTAQETTVGIEPVPVLEEFEPIQNPDGTFSVIGSVTGKNIGTFPDIEETANAALDATKQLREDFIDSSVKQSLSINGLYGNGNAFRIGEIVYDPTGNLIDAKAVANYDSDYSVRRQKQKEDQSVEKLARDEQFWGQFGQAVLPLGDAAAESDLFRIQSEKEISDILQQSRVSKKVADNVAKRVYDAKVQARKYRLGQTQSIYDIKGVDNSSVLGQLWAKAKKLGVPVKSFYTIQEARKILSAPDFNSLMSEKAAIVLQGQRVDVEAGYRTETQPETYQVRIKDKIEEIREARKVPLARKDGRIDVSKKAFDKVFNEKNIEVDYRSPEFQYFAESVAGSKSLGTMSRGQKEMLMARVIQLNRFSSKRKLPDFRPRPYTAKQLNEFYEASKGEYITTPQIKNFVKNNETGQNLTKKQIALLRQDLINSGRADRAKNNRIRMAEDFDMRQARNAAPLNETTEEFVERLGSSTNLTQEEISNLSRENIDLGERITPESLKRLPPPEGYSNMATYKQFFDEARKRLSDMGLKDIGLKFNNALASSMGLYQVGPNGEIIKNAAKFDSRNDMFFEPRDAITTGEFDAPMRRILISLDNINPEGKKTEEEMRDSIAQVIDHEVIHALIRLDLLTEREYQNLVSEANRVLPKEVTDSITENYADRDGFNAEVRREEKVAELFRLYRSSPDKIAKNPRTIIEKIISFFSNIIESIFGAGFRSPTSIMESIASGEIGRRSRDEVRSLRELRNLEATTGIPVDIARYGRHGLVPQDVLFSGTVEDAVWSLYKRFRGNIPASEMKKLYKEVSPLGKRKHSFRNLADIRKDLVSSVKMGIDRFWYERFGREVPLLVGSANMNEFSKVFGITSAQTSPEVNFKDTLRTMIIARKIDPVKESSKFIRELHNFGVGKSDPARIKSIQKVYETGVFHPEYGQKTATYALEILEAANNSFSPWSVIDRHMLAILGFDGGKMQKGETIEEFTERTGLKKEQPSFTEKEYRIMQAMMSLLATENYTINGEPFNFSFPRQVQASLWGFQKYKKGSPNEGTWDSSVQHAKEEITELNELIKEGLFTKDKPLTGSNFISSPLFTSSLAKDTFSTDQQDSMARAILAHSPAVIFQTKMGVKRGYFPETLDTPVSRETLHNYQTNLLKSIAVGNQIVALREMLIPHQISISNGTRLGDLAPEIILRLPGAPPKLVHGVTALMVDALMLDSATTSMPQPKGKRHTGLQLVKPLNKDFTLEEIENLAASLKGMTRLVAGREVPVDFTISSTERSGIILSDPRAWEDNYSEQDLRDFYSQLQSIAGESGYTLKTYGEDTELIEYEQTDENGEHIDYPIRGDTEILGDRQIEGDRFDLQRTLLNYLYIPAFNTYKKFAEEIGIAVNNNIPALEEGSAMAGQFPLTLKEYDGMSRAAQATRDAPRGWIPHVNPNASKLAIQILYDIQDGKPLDESYGYESPEDIPRFSKGQAATPAKYLEASEAIGGARQAEMPFGYRLLDVADTKEDVDTIFNRIRRGIIDKYTFTEKFVGKAIEVSPEAAAMNLMADSGAIQAIRWVERARGIFAGMIKYGTPTLKSGVTGVEFNTGLLEILVPLFADPNINKEELFKIYSIGIRGERLNSDGILVPLDQKTIDLAKEIEIDYPEVVEVWKNYQIWNNKLIDYAVETGILSNVRTNGELIADIVESRKSIYPEAELKDMENAQLLQIAGELGLETRGTAQIWKDNSDYYPFYRKMTDETIKGPNVGSGLLVGNPLNIALKGSEEAIEPAPMEVIARNSLSILTAGMKNDALRKLSKTFELANMAVKVDAKNAQGIDILPVFENGVRVFYKVADPLMIDAMQSVGMQDLQGVMKILAVPASFLREMVTRDPAFILVNMMRDTVSAYVTSGADFTPVIDTFRNYGADITELERFGVVGGYDYSTDEMDIVKFIKKEMRKQGVGTNGSLSAKDAFMKLWDFMGEQTLYSDASTRLAVYKKVKELTGNEAEAAYQAMEIINFSRRGANPLFRIITASIPFMNARIQGLDVLYRGLLAGKYSAVRKLQHGEKQGDMERDIIFNALTRGGFLMLMTLLYYAWVSDDEQYRNLRREVRDNYWVVPTPWGVSGKIPIPFEVGVLFKVIPERMADLMFGEGGMNELIESYSRQGVSTLKIDPLGFQVLKPFLEALRNKSSFTGTEIVPSYMEEGLEKGYQSRYQTNELARLIGEGMNLSPMKIEYALRGYGGTLGTYLLTLIDVALRQATGRDYIRPRLDQAPILRRFFQTPYGGGLQQQYYELRTISNRFVQTMNSLRDEGRLDELEAYRQNHGGLVRTRGQVLAIDRYLRNWRNRRDRVLHSDASPSEKRTLINQMESDRDVRLANVPELREKADIPVVTLGL